MRDSFLPFSRPTIEQEEIDEVVDSLKSGWITTGPKVTRFEEKIAKYVDADHAVALNSGTAGLHVALLALGIGPGDEVITTPMTFAATVNMILAVGATPVLVDIDRHTMNLQPELVGKALTPRTRALVPVHFAGLPCDMEAINRLARRHGLVVVEDAAHAIGTRYQGKRIGALSQATVFSFHPIKNITSGEGGMLTTNVAEVAEKSRVLRFHGINKDAWKRYDVRGVPEYDVLELGYKYNMLDLQAAIGLHQIDKLERFIAARTYIAERYLEALADNPGVFLPACSNPGDRHAWHLFVLKVDTDRLKIDRHEFIAQLKQRNIGTGIHFRAVHLHPHFAAALPYSRGDFPEAEWASDRLCSLPLYPLMTKADVDDVVAAIHEVVEANHV